MNFAGYLKELYDERQAEKAELAREEREAEEELRRREEEKERRKEMKARRKNVNLYREARQEKTAEEGVNAVGPMCLG